MQWLLDMGVSGRVAEWLRQQGHEAVHLRDLQLQRLSDDLIFEKASQEKRIVLTFDLDFGDIAAHSSLDVCVIVFRLRNARATNVIARLQKILTDHSADLTTNCILAVEETRVRVRRLPIA
jgi:predicted nuclease of predicted toxin-antitoxin system